MGRGRGVSLAIAGPQTATLFTEAIDRNLFKLETHTPDTPDTALLEICFGKETPTCAQRGRSEDVQCKYFYYKKTQEVTEMTTDMDMVKQTMASPYGKLNTGLNS